MRITSSKAQYAVLESSNLRNQLTLARTTEDTEIQKELSESSNIRLLRALASNPNLHTDVEVKLAESDNAAVVSALLNREA